MLDKALEALKTFDWGTDPKPLEGIDQAINATHGKAAERADLEQKLVDALKGDVTRCSKDYICRKLMLVGSAVCVPPLAALLGDKDLSHMARYALERIPAPEAGKALRDSLAKVPAAQKVGVASSLGSRGDTECVAALGALLGEADAALARSAALALGDIRTSAAAKALKEPKSTSPTVRPAVTDAQLACAEGLLAAGNKAEALGVYKSLVGEDQPKHVRLAATRGVLACAGKKE